METKIQTYSHPQFGEIRCITDDKGEPWFVGKDVAEKLGYSNTRDALRKHVDDDDKGVANCDTLGGTQTISIINESGLYSLILSSKLPQAKEFKHWVTSVVLPQIRKTGGYIPLGGGEDDASIMAKALLIANKTIEQKDNLLEEQRPKVEYCEDVLMSEDCVTTTQIAKQFGISAIALNNKLHNLGIQFKQSRQWFLYAKYAKMGFAKERTAPYFDNEGKQRTAITLVWTESGKRFISELIRSGYDLQATLKTIKG